MGFGTIYGKTSDIRLVSCYCSNTAAAALKAGYVVALRFTNTIYNVDSDTTNAVVRDEFGKGFGQAVDYAVGTNSVVVGILAQNKFGKTTWDDQGWALAVTRGPVAIAYASQTFTGKLIVLPSAIAGNVGCVASDVVGDGKFPYGVVGYGLTGSAGEGTGTVAVFVNTMFG